MKFGVLYVRLAPVSDSKRHMKSLWLSVLHVTVSCDPRRICSENAESAHVEKLDICMNSNMGREVFALTLITPINCNSPRFPCLLPCPNSLVTQMSAAGRREGLCLPSISSPWAAKRREVRCGLPKSVGRSLDSPLCLTAIAAIQSVLMYCGPAIRGQSSGRTSKVKLASWFPAARVEAQRQSACQMHSYVVADGCSC
jgi:hypothetical protein